MTRGLRIKQYTFPIGSLTANAAGSMDVYSDTSINGTVQSIVFQENNHTVTGSYLIFASGLGNSGTGINELIIRFRAGSENQTFYPVTSGAGPDSANVNWFAQQVVHAPLRVVGSGLGADTSGLGLTVNYI